MLVCYALYGRAAAPLRCYPIPFSSDCQFATKKNRKTLPLAVNGSRWVTHYAVQVGDCPLAASGSGLLLVDGTVELPGQSPRTVDRVPVGPPNKRLLTVQKHQLQRDVRPALWVRCQVRSQVRSGQVTGTSAAARRPTGPVGQVSGQVTGQVTGTSAAVRHSTGPVDQASGQVRSGQVRSGQVTCESVPIPRIKQEITHRRLLRRCKEGNTHNLI